SSIFSAPERHMDSESPHRVKQFAQRFARRDEIGRSQQALDSREDRVKPPEGEVLGMQDPDDVFRAATIHGNARKIAVRDLHNQLRGWRRHIEREDPLPRRQHYGRTASTEIKYPMDQCALLR